MLEAEADRLCNAERYERTAARRDQRAGSYDRKLQLRSISTASSGRQGTCRSPTPRPTPRVVDCTSEGGLPTHAAAGVSHGLAHAGVPQQR